MLHGFLFKYINYIFVKKKLDKIALSYGFHVTKQIFSVCFDFKLMFPKYLQKSYKKLIILHLL